VITRDVLIKGTFHVELASKIDFSPGDEASAFPVLAATQNLKLGLRPRWHLLSIVADKSFAELSLGDFDRNDAINPRPIDRPRKSKLQVP